MSIRKDFEHKLRYIRSYILPSHIRSAKKARAIARPVPTEKPLCVFDFNSIKIDNVTGRYLYHLVTEFEALGFAIAYTDRFRFLATMEAKACKKLLLDHPFSIVPLGDVPQTCSIVITDTPSSYVGQSVKCISVEYEHIRPQVDDPSAFPLPFFVHPDIHESGQVEQFLKNPEPTEHARPMSILFAGNAKAPKYDAAVLAEKYRILSRVKALEIAEATLGKDRTRRPLQLEQLSPPTHQRQTLTIATTQDLRIPSSDWIKTIALADFYFACPGVEMPLCHNLIESLAAGSIPILQYPQYMTPQLTDGINCLVYTDQKSLAETLNRALCMSNSQVTDMKKSAQDYYRTYLQPGNFAQQLIDGNHSKATIYLNAYRVPIEAPLA